MQKQTVQYANLGMMDYQQAWDYQEALLKENVSIKSQLNEQPTGGNAPATKHHLLLVEHPPVYTLGKSGHAENILISENERLQKGIQYFKINRGGDITFHGPGQLVGYPILDLEKFKTDIGWYLRSLEETIIKTIAHFGVIGQRSKGETGVWIDANKPGYERKICALGVRCSRWITMHGLALNVNTDLQFFNHIIPCGIADKQVTSLKKELGMDVPIDEVKNILLQNFATVFEVELSEPAFTHFN